MKNILSGAVLAATFGAIYLSWAPPAPAAQLVSTETVANKVRKVTIRNDDGTTTERFEICVADTARWFEAQRNPDGSYSLTEKGRTESQAYHAEIIEWRRRQERDDRRAE